MLEKVQNLKGETLLKVVAYGFQDFINDLEEAFEQGYRLDFESNENYPQQIGNYYSALLPLKGSQKKVVQAQPEVEQEQETSQEEGKTQARGRKKAG